MESFIIFDAGPEGHPIVFTNPKHIVTARTKSEVDEAFETLQRARYEGDWLAGFVSYELGYLLEPKLTSLMPVRSRVPLLCFGLFDQPEEWNQSRLGRVQKTEVALFNLKPLWSRGRYTDAFEKVKNFIHSGEIYQANLTFPITAEYVGNPLSLYAALQSVQKVQHGALIHLEKENIFLSRSPELFFRIDRWGRISTKPMKGTMPRGKTVKEDERFIKFLKEDSKIGSENLMIIDVLRHDLSRIAKPGSVRVPTMFEIETYATIHQMTSLVQAELREGISFFELFQALFPSGSITGAPKIRAMEILRDLEPDPREIYCGSVGWMAPDGQASFNVAIRTLTLLDEQNVRLNVGGGIVYDSTSRLEYEEALWKARYTDLSPKT